MDIQNKYPKCRTVIARKAETIYPGLSEKEAEIVKYHNTPCHPDTIHQYLIKMAMEKHLKGDAVQQAYRLTNDTERLRGITEIQMYQVMDHFTRICTKEWFPNFATMREFAVKKGAKLGECYDR